MVNQVVSHAYGCVHPQSPSSDQDAFDRAMQPPPPPPDVPEGADVALSVPVQTDTDAGVVQFIDDGAVRVYGAETITQAYEMLRVALRNLRRPPSTWMPPPPAPQPAEESAGPQVDADPIEEVVRKPSLFGGFMDENLSKAAYYQAGMLLLNVTHGLDPQSRYSIKDVVNYNILIRQSLQEAQIADSLS